MKTVAFIAYVNFGKCDDASYDVEVKLTDEEYNRVKQSMEEYECMNEDESISDIYEKVYKAALNMDIEALRDDKKYLAERMEEHLDISYEDAFAREYTDEEITDMLEENHRSVNYPDLLEDD